MNPNKPIQRLIGEFNPDVKEYHDYNPLGSNGTLLDYFAAAVMPAIYEEYGSKGYEPDILAVKCYRHAAAMLVERKKYLADEKI
jgi:hypothetical protein